ncbi:prostasin-like [Lissotriton helveticus]
MGLAPTLAAVLLLFHQGFCDVRPEEAYHSRIVGGMDASSGQYPWQVSVTYGPDHVCGGSLIDTSHVLTAAHCFPGDHDLKEYLIRLGITSLQVPEASMVAVKVTHVEIYTDYVEGGSGDIAVVTLEREVALSDKIQPIALPCGETQFPVGMMCTVSGWGNIHQTVSLPSPQTLQAALVPLISQRTCKCLYRINPSGEQHEVMYDMICAGYVSGAKDACQGDSGGPLSCKVGDTYYQAGIVSWGDECGSANRVGVYTQTSVYATWIARYAPGAKISCPTIDITPAEEPEGGCIDADGVFHANGASSLALVAASLPLYFLTVYLLSAL